MGNMSDMSNMSDMGGMEMIVMKPPPSKPEEEKAPVSDH